ncbi:MAG TPA: ATP-binding protein, partial [Propionibacteriaceae bacterium]
ESSLRIAVVQVVEQASAVFGFTPRVRFDGPLDTVVQQGLVDDVQAVVREALTNAAKYARATDIQIDVTAEGARLVIAVFDNGAGMATTKRRSGIANLRKRAMQRGGSLAVAHRPEGGTQLRWSVPAS